MTKTIIPLIAISIVSILSSCKKEEPAEQIIQEEVVCESTIDSIYYPTTATSYLNILSDTTINYTGGLKYCFAAYLPNGSTCKVRYKARAGGSFGNFPAENVGWTINGPSLDDWWELTAIGQQSVVSIPVMFGPPDSVDVFVYENDSPTPVIAKAFGY